MITRDENGYEIKPKEWFNGLSSDTGASLTDPRAVPEECRKFSESIKNDENFYNSITYQQTIDFIDKHYLGWLIRLVYNPKLYFGRILFSFKLFLIVFKNKIKVKNI